MPKKLKAHPELKYDARFTHWEAEHYLAWLDEKVAIDIEADEKGPTTQQLRLYKQIIARRRSLRNKIEVAFFDHYQEDVYDTGFCIMTPDGEYEPTPQLFRSSEIWQMLGSPLLHIHEMSDDDDSVRFTMDYCCDWDEEHGTTIFIQDWQIEDMGDSGQRFF